AAPVAGPYEQLPAAAQKRLVHRHLPPVGQDRRRVAAEGLDEGEDVVPAAEIEPGRVIAQLVQNLVHLQGGGQRLDKDGGPDASTRQVQFFLGVKEHVVPQTGLEMPLQLRQIEIRSGALRQETAGVVEEEQAEIEQGGRHGTIVHFEVP